MGRKEYLELYRLVTDFYHHLLVNTEEGEKVYAYLTERGVSREMMEKFQVGYSHKGDILLKWLQSRGYEAKELLEAGLLRVDQNGEYRDFFYGRILFPIHNDHGQVVGFSGRVLPGNTHPAKYLNSPDTAFFAKGELLFNFHQAKTSIKQKNALLLLEGYLDSISAVQHGIDHVVSAMGTALTEHQLEKIHTLTNRIVICYDGDKAGMQSAIKRSRQFLDKGFEVRLAVLPQDTDPHDYLAQNGSEAFLKEIVSNARTHIAFCKEVMKRTSDFSIETDRVNYVKEILSELAKEDVAIEVKRTLLAETASDVNVDMNFLKMIYQKK